MERKRDRKATTEQNTAQLALLLFLLTFFYIIYIYLFINYKLSFFFGGRFLLLLFVFIFAYIFSGLRRAHVCAGGGRVWCLIAVFVLRHVWRVGIWNGGSTLAQYALGPLPFLSRHVLSNFCTIHGLNYTLMRSKIWGYQQKKSVIKFDSLYPDF